ncbi:hypothetical protein KM043_007590 [Ampulex compressa]|nr:hypothetical protein KM043_007590 [Ampulex compressa]
MTTLKPRQLILTLTLGTLAIGASGRSWDLAVVIGREIDFFARNQSLTGQAKIAEAVALTGVAYDDLSRTMYLSDVNSNVSVFSTDLTEKKNFSSKSLLKKQSGSYIQGIVFDTATRTLFWTDALKEVIMKMHVPLNGPPGGPVLLHNLTRKNPHGINLDVCNRHLYWTNSNSTNPSIERSRLDGSDRRTVIEENLYEPVAVAVDHVEQKLYWLDDVEGINFKIERSNFDGSERELLVHSKHQQPVYLAVDRDSIYWSDRVYSSVWTMPKNCKPGTQPTIFKSYHASNRDADPASILTRDNVGRIDCEAIARMEKRTNVLKPSTANVPVYTYNNLTTSTEESDLTTESSRYCLNDGHLERKSGACRCKPGFFGTHCETSVCHNYCLRGNCKINNHGVPECECASTYVGPRCERNVCDGYCLHDSQCSVQNGKPTCKCKYSNGPRCENLSDIVEFCTAFCNDNVTDLVTFEANPCRCAEMNQMAAKIVTYSESFEYSTLLPIFTALIVVLVLLIAVLSYYVNKLRRRPRIKKRFVVSKGGVTPLTSRPQIPDNQCEITIENCCNMNICETPCFEPKLRNAGPRSNNTKKEEKNSLLDNMEGNSC